MRTPLNEQSVINANAQFWGQMLAMTLEPMSSPEDFCASAGYMMGSVGLAGAWTGRIEVRMAGCLAYQATAAMMMQALDTVDEADALDATKEIANMIAGTIKSCLPRPCSMTTPESVLEREEYHDALRSEDSLMVAFRHTAGDLMVRVWEQGCVQAAATEA